MGLQRFPYVLFLVSVTRTRILTVRTEITITYEQNLASDTSQSH